MSNTYWTGPYAMLVPDTIQSVCAKDGYNRMHKDGSVTDGFRKDGEQMTKEMYLATYAELNEDEQYYYKIPPTDNFWTGPYGMKVSLTTKKVPSVDGINTRYQNGGETDLCNSRGKYMNNEEYLSAYATLGNDGYYYYIF